MIRLGTKDVEECYICVTLGLINFLFFCPHRPFSKMQEVRNATAESMDDDLMGYCFPFLLILESVTGTHPPVRNYKFLPKLRVASDLLSLDTPSKHQVTYLAIPGWSCCLVSDPIFETHSSSQSVHTSYMNGHLRL